MALMILTLNPIPLLVLVAIPTSFYSSLFQVILKSLVFQPFSNLLLFLLLKLLVVQVFFNTIPSLIFFQNFGSINGVRLIGSSGMYTNTAAENYRAGVITACQVRNSTTWDTFISPTAGVGYGLVSSYEDSYDKGAFNGCYGWIKPSSHDTFKFRDYMTVNNGVLIDTFSPIVPEDDFIIIYASIPNTGSASGGTSPQAGFWTFNYDIEYATSNKWVDCRKTSTHAAAITAALAMIRNLPNFDENPSHIQDFWNYISNGFKSVDSAVVKYAPVADALVSLIGSL